MPQLDKYIFFPQYAWLCLLFFLGYYGLLSFGLPRLLAILKFRRLRLGGLRRSAAALEVSAGAHQLQFRLRQGRLGLVWTAAVGLLSAAVGRRLRSGTAAGLAANRGRPLQRSGRRRPLMPVRGPLFVGLSPHWWSAVGRPVPPLPAAVALLLLRLRSVAVGQELVAAVASDRWNSRLELPTVAAVRFAYGRS